MNPTRTGIGLYARRDFTSPNVVEEGNILPEYSLKVALSNTLRIDFAGIHPHIHVQVRANEHCDTL